MASMQLRNTITLIGNLGSDPAIRTTEAGLTIAEFSLATNETYRDRNGDRKTRTEWHKVKAFGKLAETFAQHLSKGSQICLAGSLRYNKWIDKYDQVRNTAEIVAHSFTFLSPSKQSHDTSAAASTSEVAEPAPPTAPKTPKRRKSKTASATKKVQAIKAEVNNLPF